MPTTSAAGMCAARVRVRVYCVYRALRLLACARMFVHARAYTHSHNVRTRMRVHEHAFVYA